MPENESAPSGFIASIVRKSISSHLSIILLILSLCLGISAILVTPKEEEPQIVVPMADVYVYAPGSNATEIEKLVATPLERLLWQIDGVEYVYSMSREDMAIVTVRFYVGEDRENSLVKLHNKITMNIDAAPPIVKGWVIKPVEIDDVPIVNISLYSDRYDDYELRRIGEEVLSRLSSGLGVSLLEVQRTLRGADASVTAGKFSRFNKEVTVTSKSFLLSSNEVSSLMVGVHNGRPVYLRDIANIFDGPEESKSYSRIGYSNFYRKTHNKENTPFSFPAVTLAIAKKKGTNAVTVSENILVKLEELKKSTIPDGVNVEVIRDYGKTAGQKVNGLLGSLAFAVISVIILLAVTLGWREALVVALAVPVSFSLALFVNYLFGYTINRVTLFALILSLGLVVDDPITNVDNIQRHILMGKRKAFSATLFAVNEVLPPVIMSTLAIIISFIPLFFITGMMGPYMAPMAANVPLTVTFSTLCALTIVPWLTHLLLKNMNIRKMTGSATNQIKPNHDKGINIWIGQIYRKIVSPFLKSKSKRYMLLAAIIFLLLVSISLAVFRLVPLKILPFDNKNEFQIVIDMPEGTTLETTNTVVQSFENFLREIPEITSFVSYVGNSSPMDFNGMVRHYYLRKGSHLADIRINYKSR